MFNSFLLIARLASSYAMTNYEDHERDERYVAREHGNSTLITRTDGIL